MCVDSCALEDKVKLYHNGFSHLKVKIRLAGRRRAIETKYSSLKPLHFCFPAPRFHVHVFICSLFHIDVSVFLSE